MSRTTRTLVALAAAAISLVIAAWFDGTFLRDAMRLAAASFDSAAVAPLLVLGSLMVAGAVLLLGALAWRAGSLIVGLAYIVVGAVIVTLPWLAYAPATAASALGTTWISTSGQLNAVGTIGAGMLIAGIAALVPWWRGRAAASNRTEAAAPTADPLLP